MASTIKVDQIEGSTGSTVTVPTGQTLTLTDGLAQASLPVVGVAKGGTNLSSFTAGDVLYATGSTTLAKLAKGTAEQVLAMNAGATAPDWGSVDLTVLPTITVAKGGTNLSSFTAGDILYATGATTLAKLAKGSAADVLAMNAGATAPEWVAPSGGKVLQVVETQVTSTMTCNNTSPTYESPLTRAITPIAAGSKIMVEFRGGIMAGNNNGYVHLYFDVAGGGYAVCDPVGAAAGSRMRCHGSTNATGEGSGAFSVSILHTPTYSLAEEITYRVYSEVDNGSYPFYIGRTFADSDNDNQARTQSTLTCTEIGA